MVTRIPWRQWYAASASTQCGRTLTTRDGIVIRVWRVWDDGPRHIVTQSGAIVWGPSEAGEDAALHASVTFYDQPVAPQTGAFGSNGKGQGCMTTIKVGDKVAPKGWTRDDLGTGNVIGMEGDRGTFLVQWDNVPGGGWKDRDLILVEAGPDRDVLEAVTRALNPLEDASTPDADYAATMRAVIQFCEGSLERFKANKRG